MMGRQVVDTLQLLLLERPLAVFVALVFAEGICLVVLYARRTRRALIGAAVPVVLGLIVAVLSVVVTTQRERVAAALEGLRLAVVAGDGAGFAAGIDQDYDDGVYPKDKMVGTVARTRAVLALRDVKFSDIQIEVDGARAVVDCRAVLHVRENPPGRGLILTRWRLWWARRSDRWRLMSSRLVEPENLPRAPRGPR